MQKSCGKCGVNFEISEEDLKFYDKISPVFDGKKFLIPGPRFCSDCRQQRRWSFRNERNLYHRKSDFSGKQIISMYEAERPYKVYDQSEWWSDKWDAKDYGREFDFSRPFFEQFSGLMKDVPRINLINKEHENSEYCNFAIKNKNSYLLFTSAECEDSFYSNRLLNDRNVCDCSNVTHSELCYEVIDSDNCYNCAWVQASSNCSDCFFGYDLKSCNNCFASHGLVNKSYCIGNKQLTKDEYLKQVEVYRRDFDSVRAFYAKELIGGVRKYINGTNIENCTGDSISSSKNCMCCFEVKKLEDCKYVTNATDLKDCYDLSNDDKSELDYETIGADSNYHQCFSDICWYNSNIFYCSLCFNSQNLFGCVGMKRSEYCIFNKQYSKEEYEKLVPRIIEHMEATGEWGEFFPSSISPFEYGESMAQEYFPEAVSENLKSQQYAGPRVEVAKNIEDVDNSICSKILQCEVTGKPYKILPQELVFYKKMKVPVPLRCPDERHRERLRMRNPRRLIKRSCNQCSRDLLSSYPLDFPGKIYCEECYLKITY